MQIENYQTLPGEIKSCKSSKNREKENNEAAKAKNFERRIIKMWERITEKQTSDRSKKGRREVNSVIWFLRKRSRERVYLFDDP